MFNYFMAVVMSAVGLFWRSLMIRCRSTNILYQSFGLVSTPRDNLTTVHRVHWHNCQMVEESEHAGLGFSRPKRQLATSNTRRTRAQMCGAPKGLLLLRGKRVSCSEWASGRVRAGAKLLILSLKIQLHIANCKFTLHLNMQRLKGKSAIRQYDVAGTNR